MQLKGVYKAAKLIKVKLNIENGKIKDIRITGDFFMYPEDAIRNLERALIGSEYKEEIIKNKIKSFMVKENIQTPLITPGDFVKAIMNAKPEE
ncbi:MAG: lipoate--protein ligase family protein [Candidatus Methanomethylicota archaeon]|nr:MAG: lipoate--protein ligase family protein [Candidatus Verstraetearchaeota archaeon]